MKPSKNKRELDNVVIVGLGRQGNVHLEAAMELHNIGLVNNVYAFDSDIKYLDWMHTVFNFKKLDSLKKKLRGKTVYIICSPNDTHDNIIATINLNNECAIFLKEKPLYKNKKIDLHSKNIHIAQQRFFNSAYLFAKDNLDKIGKIKFFEYQYSLNDNKESWYWDKERGGGCFINIGWHFLFLINWFFGPENNIEIIKMKTDRKSFKYDTDDTNFIDVKYGLFFGKSYLSVSDASKRDIFRIIGDKGTIEVNKEKCIIFNLDGSIKIQKYGNEILSYMRQIVCISQKTQKYKSNSLKSINLKVNDYYNKY